MKLFWYIAIMLFALKVFFVQQVQAEAGMIPMDSPVGEIGGRGHWYSLRTMKGELYWEDPAYRSNIRENDDGTYSMLGEAPISVVLALHPEWDGGGQPWRVAIDWLRQAEQMFRNSGVPVRFLIEHIETVKMDDTVSDALYDLYWAGLEKHGADLVIGLMPVLPGDSCGVAYIGGRHSISGCSPLTLAHEIGHNLGLHHAHHETASGRKGYCASPSADAKDCEVGTIMSYGKQRIPLFAAQGFTLGQYDLGTEDHTAVEYLRSHVVGKALAWELEKGADKYQARTNPEIAVCD